MGAEQSITIRLSLKDGENVSQALRRIADEGDQSFSRLSMAAQKPNAALKGLNAAVSETKNAAIGLATGLGPVGSVMTSMGPAGLALALALGGVSIALRTGVREFEQAEQASLRFQAVLRATGNSSGVTAQEVESMADAMEGSTQATAEGVKEAAAALATFRTVSGQNFKETIRLSQDLAATFGGDMRSAAVQLGKALEDPEHGLTQLRRSGISFTDAQKDMIVEMFKAGDAAKAQSLILAEVRKQVGGAGEGEAGGLTGATHHLSAAWGNLFENFVRTQGVGEEVNDFIRRLTNGIILLDKSVNDVPDFDRQIVQKTSKVEDAKKRLADLQNAQKTGDWDSNYGTRYSYGIAQEKARIEALEKEIDLLRQKKQASADAETHDRQAAEQGAIDAQLWKAREDIAQRQKDLDRELVTSFQDAASKKRAIAEQLDKDVATANAKRDKIGYTDADVDAEISALQRIAANKVEAIEKPIRESQQRIRDQVAKTIAELDVQADKAANPRQSAIDQAVLKLPKEATPADREDVAQRAGRVYDLIQRQKELNDELEIEGKLREKGKQITQQFGPAQDAYNARIAELNELLSNGAIGHDAYARAAEDAYDRMLDASDNWEAGATRALRSYVDEAGNAARQSERVMTSSLQAGEDALVKWQMTGKFAATDLFNTIAEEGLRAVNRLASAQLFGSSSGGGGGFFGSLLGGASGWLDDVINGGSTYEDRAGFLDSIGFGYVAEGYHGGGIPARGESSFKRRVSADAFDGAPRYHSGIRPGEKAAIITNDEGVFTPRQMDNADRLISAAMSRPPITVNTIINNNASNKVSASANVSQGSNGEIMAEVFIDEIDQQLAQRAASGGSQFAQVMERRNGLSQVPVR